MSIKENDIRRALINYMRVHNKQNQEMAKLCGMSSPSMFSQYQSGTTKTLKAEYLLHFLINTKINLAEFLPENFDSTKNVLPNNNLTNEPAIANYSCHNCKQCDQKQYEIDRLSVKVGELTAELYELQKKYIQVIEPRKKEAN